MGSQSSVPRLTALGALLVVVTGCPSARVEAPEDLEGLAKYIWTQQSTASDEELGAAVQQAHAVLLELLVDTDAQIGVLPYLSDEDLAPIGQDGVNDPSEAPGFFLATRFDCDLDVLAEMLTHPEQDSLRPDVYDSYARTFAGDRDAWLDDDTGALEWDVVYEVTPTVTQYKAKTHSSVRHVPKLEDAAGAAVVQRTFLKEPAVFVGEPDDHVFDQDYQAELFLDGGEGEIFHLYGLWRFMQLGIVGIHDDAFVDVQLDGMVKWDEQTEAACATWPELPEG